MPNILLFDIDSTMLALVKTAYKGGITMKKSVANKIGTILSKTALSVALTTSNVTCFYTAYQPVEPKGLSKFKK
jgi:cyclic lactone autoinducer peptide